MSSAPNQCATVVIFTHPTFLWAEPKNVLILTNEKGTKLPSEKIIRSFVAPGLAPACRLKGSSAKTETVKRNYATDEKIKKNSYFIVGYDGFYLGYLS